MKIGSSFILCVIVLLGVLFKHSSCQCIQTPNIAQTTETSPPGTILINLMRPDNNTAASFEIRSETLSNPTYRADLKSYFLLSWSGLNGTLTINKTLDLEEFSNRFEKADLTSIGIDYTCLGTVSLYINVQPVNEFRPIFNHGPYNISLIESTPVGTVIFSLQGKVTDLDVPTPPTFYFGIVKYLISELDAMTYFTIGATTIGNLNLTKPLNFSEKKELRLNLTVKDSNSADAKEAYTTLYINVTDADNQNPYFNLTGCPKPCVAAPYSSATSLVYTGPLTIQPEAFRVVDDDTLGTTLLYSIESGNYNNMFQIDRMTGAVVQTRSVTDANFLDAEFRLVIKIRKDLSLDLSNIAILTIAIAGRTPINNNTDIPVTRKSTDKSDSSLLIPLIVLGVFLAILVVLLVVAVVLYYKKQKEMAIHPDDKSEPHTEEEELPTDRSGELPHVADFNDKVVLNGKTTQGMTTDPLPPTPDERAGKLPPLPLRDSATETSEIRRKKRSRRRNKNKEPEIFDGTQEYNMGADPEFFDSSDKSKVKRSQRSYDKKVDPALWIKVPNDNPANDDSGFSG